MKPSRRTVLKMSPGLAALGWTASSLAAAETTENDSSFDPWVELHVGNVRHNVSAISRRVEGRPILAVIKNNGYGTGVAEIGRALEPLEEVAGVAVVKLQEAMTLRDSGIKKPVLLMGPYNEKELELAAARNIMPMVYRPIGDELDRVAAKLQRKIPIHICVDTGMGRVGIPYREAAPLVRDLAGRASVEIEGIMTALAEEVEFDKEQVSRLRALCDPLKSAGARLGRMHAASSFALFENSDTFLDMVRPGMAVFGVYSEAHFREMDLIDLRPAMALRARVIYVKKLAKGDSVGYGRAFEAQRDVWVATLPVGHVDGWPRDAANGASVRIGETHYPVIGAVSASHTIVELGAEPSVSIGDVATCFDWETGSRPEDVAAATGASVYNLAMHLNPLLPKRSVG